MHREEQKYEEAKLISIPIEDSENAYQLLYDRYRKRIYQTALRYLKSPILIGCKFVAQTHKAIPAIQKFGITTRNLTDADSWIPGWQNVPDWPLLFDAYACLLWNDRRSKIDG